MVLLEAVINGDHVDAALAREVGPRFAPLRPGAA